MRRAAWAIGPMLLSLFAAVAQAQPAEIMEVQRWRMTYDYLETASNQTSIAEWSQAVVATGTVVLTKTDRNTWSGTPSVRVHYQFDGTIDNGNMCITETHIDSTALAEPIQNSATLNVFRDGYQIALGNTTVFVERRENGACQTELITQTVSRSWGEYLLDTFPYPSSGTTLESTYRRGATAAPEAPTVETDPHPSMVTIHYRLVPDVVEELRLEIDDSGDYLGWRPSAKKDSSSGQALTVRARVVSSTGKEPTARVLRYAWSLTGTSREPGIAMNFPIGAQDSEFDLRFEADEGDGAIVTEMGQKMERNVSSGFEDAARVVPYDWGGWATLQVVALLDDGRMLTGKAKSVGTDGLKLPKRAEGSLIADAWKTKWGARGADDADDENAPAGDGTPGDGLTLYQEYRGFYVNGEQVSGEPLLKELFVLTAEAARSGVVRFQRLSGLKVHHRLREDEFPFDRVMNGNRREGPTRQPQTGLQVVVKEGPGKREAATGAVKVGGAVGGPGNPKKILELVLMADWSLLPANERHSIVAHELFHGVNVYHHGDSDELVAWHLDDDGEVAETTRTGQSKISVFREIDHDITENFATFFTTHVPRRIWRGAEGGQHSGDDGCLMRYYVSKAYVGQPDVTRRYFVDEALGDSICRTTRGAGVNGMRAPQPRYGDAGPLRGNCAGQILVNDAVEPPER